MPVLDPGRVALRNPQMLDVFNVQRRAVVIDSFGRQTLAVTIYNKVRGVVYPAGENNLVRQEDQQHGRKTIEIVTQFRLQMVTPGFQADQVVWRGNTYVIKELNDFSAYGDGWIQATASSVDATEAAPLPA